MRKLKGVIFDLDGTLVDSQLDFDRMRKEIGIPEDHSVLEYVESLPHGPLRDQSHAIILRHEMEGARLATLMPGVRELLDKLTEHRMKLGILTRNLIGPTRLTLQRLNITELFYPVLTREDAPPKPHPGGLLAICREWRCEPSEALFVGDYRFDLEAGRRAGMKTVLYAPEGASEFAEMADFVTSSFSQLTNDFEKIASQVL